VLSSLGLGVQMPLATLLPNLVQAITIMGSLLFFNFHFFATQIIGGAKELAVLL